MARQLNMDTLQQDFWKEEYLKELMLRFRWHQRYGASVKARQEQLRQRRQATGQPLKLPALQSPTPMPQAEQPPEEPTRAAGGIQEGEMMPVAPEVRQLLYQGISQDGEGRRRYLTLRTAHAPEEKYYTPVTTNFVYGWQMGKATTVYVPPSPKCRIESFFRKNGAFSLLDPRDVAM
ncbi:protein ATP6V1FNB [Malaclemys terrapin pileata]|uniref:protein ATP6V1FNB n=1 Tax=Malaclemys terrapin pileata TaxID=2991368 RepID=UPI0023A7EDD2|nr:protein ATP6V1FNB [Malaclemys terrapin pileata]